MRQIKFRGRTESGHWVYGTPVYYQSGEVCIFNDSFDHYGCEATNIAAARGKVDPCTVGQFTGLKDKNGKEIWEGDIVKRAAYPTLIFPVQYNHGGFNAGDYIARKLNVVGNIHDNPELLQS